jgi:hypothetical protein
METANERIDLVDRANAICLILELNGPPNVLGRCPLSGESDVKRLRFDVRS